ncbi:MAG: glycine cleavage T C-terminal barrel domain-containing protein [Dehalococcoidia bacterium]
MSGGLRSVYSLAMREVHLAAGARMYERGGWSIPEDFGDQAAEYRALREGAAVMDRSQHSRYMVTGTDALDLLRAALLGHVEDLEEGRAMRSAWLDEDGKIGDLLLVARTGGIAYLVSGEPSRRLQTLERLRDAAGEGWDVEVSDRTESTCLVALAGPAAAQVAGRYLSDALPGRVRPMQASAFEFHGFRALAIRSSDTCDDGFQLMLAPAVAQHIFETLAHAGIPLAGDAAHNVARVEACIPAWDPDLEPGLTPAQADIDVALGIPGGDEGVILSGVLVEGPRLTPGTALTSEGRTVGQVRSCVLSGLGGATIGLAILESAQATPGTELRAGEARVTVVAKPFYRRRRTD